MTVSQQLPQMNVGARSDTGKVREENQDRMTRTQVPLGDLYVVADGMGGYQGGAQAAQLTIQTVEDYLRLIPSCTPVEEAIARAIEAANTRVHSEANSGNPNTEKMGSTIVLLLVTSQLIASEVAGDSALSDKAISEPSVSYHAHIAHVGDSRAYLVRQNQLKLLTRDHTAVQRMLDAQIITEEEAVDHPDSSLLSRAIGPAPGVEPEILKPFPLEVGDAVLMCSDGLSRYVNDTKILEIATAKGSEQEIAQRLVDLALHAGGEDNVTVQFARFAVRSNLAAPKWTAMPLIRTGMAGVAGFVLGAFSLVGYNAMNVRSNGTPAEKAQKVAVPEASSPIAQTKLPAQTPIESTDKAANPTAQGAAARAATNETLPGKAVPDKLEATNTLANQQRVGLEKQIAVLQKKLDEEKKQTASLKQQLAKIQVAAQPGAVVEAVAPGLIEKKKDPVTQPPTPTDPPPPEGPKQKPWNF